MGGGRGAGLLFSLLAMLEATPAQPNMPRDYAIEVSAQVQTQPPRIDLSWPLDPRALSYHVFRKRPDHLSWQALGTLPGSSTAYSDPHVALGQPYEYAFIKKSNRDLTGYDYIFR